jgi:hypothetical protein
VWGNAEGIDNIVWGNSSDDNIVWGNSDDDNIVWGNSADEEMVFGDDLAEVETFNPELFDDLFEVEPVENPAPIGSGGSEGGLQ